MARFNTLSYITWRVICAAARRSTRATTLRRQANAAVASMKDGLRADAIVKKFSSVGWQVRIRRKGLPTL